ncbi:MAG: hypothetical protein B6D71_07890 [gamma proteobacterium symbiont of Stewartia floridana]|nr:MAG: hypothetical protein B6D71_07890 [gamma proteobacterium symbiont of Stewartia floridana]
MDVIYKNKEVLIDSSLFRPISESSESSTGKPVFIGMTEESGLPLRLNTNIIPKLLVIYPVVIKAASDSVLHEVDEQPTPDPL